MATPFLRTVRQTPVYVSVSSSLSCGLKDEAQVGRKNLLLVFFK